MPRDDRSAYPSMKETVIPRQQQGGKLDTDFDIFCASRVEAAVQFRISAARMLNVNAWDRICAGLSAHFEITTSAGIPVQRQALAGDYFRISIPGPGSVEGDGYDWVRIETIEHAKDTDRDEDRLSMRVRPAPNPTNDHHDVAHFFGPESTST